MKIILEKPTLINGAMYAAGDTVEITAMCEIEQGYAALDAITLKTFVLDAPCLIGGDIYQVGDEISSTAEIVAKGYKDYEKTIVRAKITESAGDVPSLLGTTSDAVQLLVIMQCIHVAALNQSSSFDDYKKAYQQALDNVNESKNSLAGIASQCTDLLAQMADKTVVFPYSVKYSKDKVASVFADVATRATAISKQF